MGTGSRLSAPSVLSNSVKIIDRQPASDVVKVKIEPVLRKTLTYQDYDGGLSDNDEMMGVEREAAINSPPKGKKRVTSEVFFYLLFI
jgi:hypothetical protein